MRYRVGNHNKALVYAEPEDEQRRCPDSSPHGAHDWRGFAGPDGVPPQHCVGVEPKPQAEHYTPRPRGELVAVFVRQDSEHELDALHYVRAMNATMPGCTCRVICCCGALVGTTSGCETCEEHDNQCLISHDYQGVNSGPCAASWTP